MVSCEGPGQWYGHGDVWAESRCAGQGGQDRDNVPSSDV